MKKILLIAAAVLSLILYMEVSSIYKSEYSEKTGDAPLPLEKVLMYSDWTDDTGRELSFSENYSGELDGRSFRWSDSQEGFKLSYLPDTMLGSEHSLKLYNEDGRMRVMIDDSSFIQSCYAIKAENKEAPDPLIELGQEIADYASGYEGFKYVYGGKSPETGFDCSGLTYYVYDRFGYAINRVAADQAKQGVHVEPEELQPGDLLCFYTSGNYIGHVGLYLGDGYYIHAMGQAYGVVKTALDDPYNTQKYEARRILGCEELLKEAA